MRKLILWLLAGLASITPASATTVTGTIKFQGTPLTGYYDVALSYPGTTGTYIALSGADPNGHVRLANGVVGPLTLEGNDTLLPRNSYYQFIFYNVYAQPVASLKYFVSGSTFDIGTAVPTPITPANISYLDLLGLRNVSTTNLSVANAITVGGGATYGALGVTNAKMLMDTRYASAYASGSTTCGVQEALTALPATGGTIILQLGVCTATSGVTISKPVRIQGHGRGGGTLVSSALAAPSVLANGTTSASLFTVTPGSATLAGVSFSDFAILGNSTVGGASAGDCIKITGGAPAGLQVYDVTLDQMFIYGCYGAGVHASDGIHGLTLTRSFLSSSLGSGVLLDAPTSGLLTGTTISASTLTLNTLSGVTITGATVGPVAITTSTLTSNTVDGVNLVSGSTAAVLTLTASTLTDNHHAGVTVADGLGSVVADSQILPGSHQLYGVYAPLPTVADPFTTQLTLRGNALIGNLTADIYEGASTTYLLLYPPTERLGGTGVVYTFLAPSAVHQIMPSVSTICNANGCYTTAPDGYITASGISTTATGGQHDSNISITFPVTFSSTTNLRLQVSGFGLPNNDGNPHAMDCHVVTESTSGATAVISSPTGFGGSGYGTFTGSEYCNWYAFGK